MLLYLLERAILARYCIEVKQAILAHYCIEVKEPFCNARCRKKHAYDSN